MHTSSSPLFIITNKFGTAVHLTLVQAVQLAQFIGFRRGQPLEPGAYRYDSETAQTYRNRTVAENGLYGYYSRFIIDWHRNLDGHDVKIIFRFGDEEERLTVSELGKIYTALIRFIAAHVKGLKFPGWRNLSFHSHVKLKFSGFGFSQEHPGKLVEYNKGKLINKSLVSHNAYMDNVNLPRPDYVKKLCFGGREYHLEDCKFIIN